MGLLSISGRPPRTPFFYRQTWRSLPLYSISPCIHHFPRESFSCFQKPSAIKEEENKKWKQMTTISCSHTFLCVLPKKNSYFLHWTVVLCGRFRWYRWKKQTKTTWANNDLVSSSHRFRGDPLSLIWILFHALNDLVFVFWNLIFGFVSIRKPVADDTLWPIYSRNEPRYFILNGEVRGIGHGPRATACAFWNEFMPLITARQSESIFIN